MLHRKALWLAAVVLVLATAVYAQTTYATITGTVMDPSGAVIPKAAITATNLETNIVSAATSNDAGVFTIGQLGEGRYTVRVEAAGFKEFLVQDLVLRTRDVRRVDATLQMGAAATAIVVNGGEIPQMETETARVSDLKTGDMLKTMPMNARWLWDYFAQVPGMMSSGDGYRFSGSTGNLANFAIDGITMNDGKGYQIGPLLNYMESFGEVKVDVANNSAEFVGVGNVEVVTKSGTNGFHGAAYDQYWTPGLKARNYFSNTVDPTRFHIFGGGIGGPVYIPKVYNGKNKTFFYSSFEMSRGNGNTTFSNATVPLAAWRKGDFSSLLPDTVIYDPTTNKPFPGNIVPGDRINPVSQKLQDRFYPLPNSGDVSSFASSNFQEVLRSTWAWNRNSTTRLDHHFSDRDFVFGRYSDFYSDTRFLNGMSTIGFDTGHRTTRAATVTYTHVFTPTIMNELRWGFNSNQLPYKGPVDGQEQLKTLGLTGLAPNLPNVPGMLKVSWNGIGLTPLDQYNGADPGWQNHNDQFQDYVNIFRGRHKIKFGIDLVRARYDELETPANLFGAVSFSSQFTSGGVANQGHPYADFLLGIPTSSSRQFPGLRQTENRWQYAAFINDDFKLSPTLTLNLGLRYQQHMPWTETHGRLAAFDIGSGSIVVPQQGMSQVSPLMPTNYVKVVSASSLGLPETLVRPDRNDFAPRIGVAWLFAPKSVLRAAYDIYYDIVPYEYITYGSPFALNEFPHTNPANNPDVILPRVFPDKSTDTVYDSVGLPSAVNPNMRTPMTQTYSLAVEHEVFKTVVGLTYTGTAQRYGTYSYNYNAPIPDGRPYASKPRAFPQYPDISYRTNGAGHQYNGLMTTLKRTFSSGSLLNFAWTWARDVYDLERWDAPENPFNRQRERGVNQWTPTHRVVANGHYELPFGQGRKVAGNAGRLSNLLVGGWSLSSTLGYNSGQFLTPMWNGPDPTGTVYTDSGSPAWVSIRPDQIRDANLAADQRSISKWFDTGAFAAPGAGRFGTSAKGVIKGPNCLMWNVGFGKQLTFGEKVPRILLQGQFKNITNRRNWNNPDTNISNGGSVGRITWADGISDNASPRTGTLVLRIEW